MMYCVFERILNAFIINDHACEIKCLTLIIIHIFDKTGLSVLGCRGLDVEVLLTHLFLKLMLNALQLSVLIKKKTTRDLC